MLLTHKNAFHAETPQFYENDDVNPLYESERITAAAIILTAFSDYHKAKKMIQDEEVTYETFFTLAPWKREVIKLGKSAHEWFTNPPLKNGSGWTLEHCCQLLKYDPNTIRTMYLKPSVYRDYKRAVMSLGGMGGTGGRQKKGSQSKAAKLTEEQVRQIREMWSQKIVTQKALSEMYGVSDTTISRVCRGERW